MPKIQIDTPAPDFALQDFNGRIVRLSDFKGEVNIILVLNRGFT
jgi:peroxiredoxin